MASILYKHILQVHELRDILDQGMDGTLPDELKPNQISISQSGTGVNADFRISFRDSGGTFHDVLNVGEAGSGEISGSGSSGQLTLWDGTDTIFGSPAFTFTDAGGTANMFIYGSNSAYFTLNGGSHTTNMQAGSGGLYVSIGTSQSINDAFTVSTYKTSLIVGGDSSDAYAEFTGPSSKMFKVFQAGSTPNEVHWEAESSLIITAAGTTSNKQNLCLNTGAAGVTDSTYTNFPASMFLVAGSASLSASEGSGFGYIYLKSHDLAGVFISAGSTGTSGSMFNGQPWFQDSQSSPFFRVNADNFLFKFNSGSSAIYYEIERYNRQPLMQLMYAAEVQPVFTLYEYDSSGGTTNTGWAEMTSILGDARFKSKNDMLLYVNTSTTNSVFVNTNLYLSDGESKATTHKVVSRNASTGTISLAVGTQTITLYYANGDLDLGGTSDRIIYGATVA